MTRPPLALPPSGLPFLPMLPRRRPTTLRACGVFARRSLPVVPSSPLAVWAGCPSLLRSVRLWITGTNVVEWNSRRVTRSTVPRFEVQVVMITPGYALAPLTGTPEPANARENPGRSVLHSSDRSGIGADSASAASCRTGVIQYVVPHVPPLLRSFPILIVKHHEQQDVETDSFGRYSLMTGFRRLGSPLYSLSICGGFPYPSPRRSPDRKTLSPSRHWTRFPSFPESARTAALSPFHNVRAVAHEFKFEWPFEVPHALFDRERGGQLPSVLAPAAAPLEPPPVLEPAEIIVLTSDSSDDNKGVSSEGPSITSIPKEGPSIARRSKEPIPKELLEWYGYDTVEDYLPVAKKPIPEVIFKSPIPIKGCVLGLANVETWDNIVKKFRMRTPERCADKSKGKRKV
ncbi:hypothetical protein Tco_1533760 [Tanacetum coccineum]